MGKGRLEAFSDGVMAIIITIMMLDLKIPAGASLGDLRPMLPLFLAYGLSFVNIGIYWNNHHHMLHATRTVSGAILWANLHLLFWLSLLPLATAWMGEHPLSPAPVALYGADLLAAGCAYFILQGLIVRHEGPDSRLALAIGKDLKGKASVMLYAAAILCAFFAPVLSLVLIVTVALMWFVPDRRIERVMDRA